MLSQLWVPRQGADDAARRRQRLRQFFVTVDSLWTAAPPPIPAPRLMWTYSGGAVHHRRGQTVSSSARIRGVLVGAGARLERAVDGPGPGHLQAGLVDVDLAFELELRDVVRLAHLRGRRRGRARGRKAREDAVDGAPCSSPTARGRAASVGRGGAPKRSATLASRVVDASREDAERAGDDVVVHFRLLGPAAHRAPRTVPPRSDRRVFRARGARRPAGRAGRDGCAHSGVTSRIIALPRAWREGPHYSLPPPRSDTDRGWVVLMGC